MSGNPQRYSGRFRRSYQFINRYNLRFYNDNSMEKANKLLSQRQKFKLTHNNLNVKVLESTELRKQLHSLIHKREKESKRNRRMIKTNKHINRTMEKIT